ncbi:biotin transporter BioY [Paenibacillus alkaliterrae]|uniref:biotin transporter BioY n=1 Tax=Paenibacillus alkaliterrae TaxID=320909 RepID=UPI001F1CF975|nr:biotin transporter BioY [Paenibacillus alkaliterrae]MCF2937092.1 biotin transporter BioY [Paenibacillus alkaliterrae]
MPTNNIRSLVFIALFAALFIVMSSLTIKLGGSFVPITLQTLAVALAGLFLTPRNAFLSIFVVIILAAFGLPLFSGAGGIAYLTGATGGFIFAFPFCALFVSLAVGTFLRGAYAKTNKVAAFLSFFIMFELFSSLFAYVPGIPWLMHITGFTFTKAMTAGFYPFIIGDALKSLAGAVLAISLTPYIVHIRTSTVSRKAQKTSFDA